MQAMNVLVLLSGIADPKWQLPEPVTETSLRTQRASYPLLSPFDEAALEVALKLRDADPGVKISVLLAASSAQDKLLQHVASFRIDSVQAYQADLHPAWNSAALAETLARTIDADEFPADLVLIGREFGDEDDGSVPAALAKALNWSFVSQAMEIQAQAQAQAQAHANGQLLINRQFGTEQEQLLQAAPLVAAITNNARNKLRHPLLKNVMMAKKMSFALSTLASAPIGAQMVLGGISLSAPPVSATQCRMLAGDVAVQARELAQLLLNSGDTE